MLEIPAGVPVLKVRRITVVTDDAPIEFVEAHFHPERYQHYNELTTRPVEMPISTSARQPERADKPA
ncbi:MAG: UTRA domain-containing protein [Rubrobacteraceae bacterium]|nr:UTRA domain-containing protein [Rubrobacteraceae bacterium]